MTRIKMINQSLKLNCVKGQQDIEIIKLSHPLLYVGYDNSLVSNFNGGLTKLPLHITMTLV